MEIGVANQDAGSAAPVITGSVFGAGAGKETHGYSALVRGNATVTIQGNAQVGQSVYGGGEIASVGKYGLDAFQMPSILKGGGICTVSITDYAKIGTSGTSHHVFGAGQGITPDYKYGSDYQKEDWSRRMMKYNPTLHTATGRQNGIWDPYDDTETTPTYVWEYFPTPADYSTYLETLALATAPTVTIDEHASVNGDVFGGGERGITKGGVVVNINGGTIARDVYGGGSLANTNISNWKKYGGETEVETDDYWSWDNTTSKTANHTTTVNLHGGTIGHNVYGGGLGEKPCSTNTDGIAALVYGDVLVELNRNTATDNCVVKGVIHGANNYNGSPLGDVTVHVYKTQGWTDDKGTPNDDSDDVSHDVTTQKSTNATRTNTTYELKAVYGGGNEAAYDTESYYKDYFEDAVNRSRVAHVIIDGCDLTSIETVYGGGNAASVPATYVEVNSCYEIGTVFGGGNGLDKLDDGTINPGANVGYRMSDYQYDNTKSDEENAAAAAAAFNAQKAELEYGSGIALAELKGGTVHKAFGGSNTLGNVRVSATVALNEAKDNEEKPLCPLCIEEVYGAGNQADQDGTSNIDLGCISYLSEIYGGAKNADVNSDVVLTIQSGRFDRVFGGNNLGGTIRGTVTVNIEETGCHPIVIGQLYGGGNQAAYSVEDIPASRRVTTTTDENYYKNYPKVNVKSFTSIGEIYGGGYGSTAIVTGNPHVTINECVGHNATIEMKTSPADESLHTGETLTVNEGEDDEAHIEMPLHKSGTIGAIGNIFGGGNAASVSGNTNVIIGNLEYVDITTNIVAGTTDVKDCYVRSGEGTANNPYVYTSVSKAKDGVNYYERQGEGDAVTYTSVSVTVGETDVSDYYVRSGSSAPYVYTLATLAVDGTTYYMPVIGADIRGNVYGGGNAAVVTGNTNVTIGKEPTVTTPSGGSGSGSGSGSGGSGGGSGSGG